MTLTRVLGTMVAYGYAKVSFRAELELARWLEASVLEVLPEWRSYPDPILLQKVVSDSGLTIHSAHGCWGGQAIRAEKVDLGHPEPDVQRASIDDLKRCMDWLVQVGGTYLVVHPGGLSPPGDLARRSAVLAESLIELAEHSQGTGVVVCVENMPPGVYPGSRMAELCQLLRELDHPQLALALDTGHAHISAELGSETLAAGALLATTHVHDNNGRQDSHEVPGHGTIDWTAWGHALDKIGYRGPIMLECIRLLRADPSLFRPEVLAPLIRSGTGKEPDRSAPLG